MASNNTKIKKNGIYYTPQDLADFLVKPLIQARELTIFDPAYGEGSLLLASEVALSKYRKSKKNLPIYGCDKHPVNGGLAHIPSSHLRRCDFFDYKLNEKHDVIVMNPPYVRHHLLSNTKRDLYRKITGKLCELKSSSDLWAYFLVKAVSHLKVNGSIGAILPWSFLQAEYAQNIRKWLLELFENIQVLAIGADYFDDAQERIVMLWLQNYGKQTNSIKISFTQHISNVVKYKHLDKDKWISEQVVFSKNNDIDSVLNQYVNKYNFKRLGDIANIKIGVVTGCDDFFVLDGEDAKQIGCEEQHLKRVLTSSREFSGFTLNGKQATKYLLLLSKNSYRKYKHYIAKGVRKQCHLRAHSTRRKPWYCLQLGETPQAFFPYRTSQIPYLVLNSQRIQCTNTIHRIYFKRLTVTQRKWLQLSLISVPGQLSIEAHSKSYGRGMLKVEPRSLKQALVCLRNDKEIDPIYNKISKLLSNGHKIEAAKIATSFINSKLKVSVKLRQRASVALKELQKRRLER